MITYYWHDGVIYNASGKTLSTMTSSDAQRNVDNINNAIGARYGVDGGAQLVIGLPPKMN